MGRARNLTVALGVLATVALAPAVAQAGSLYVPNYASGTVSVVDTDTNAVTSTITVPGEPWMSAITPDGKTVYVFQYANGYKSLVPITVSNGAVGKSIPVNGANSPDELAITPDGSKAYVPDSSTGAITPVDLGTGQSGNPISVQSGSPNAADDVALSISPDGSTVWVSNYGHNQVVPVNVSTGTAGTPISVNTPYYSAITPDGKTLWVIDYQDETLVPIDTATGVPGTGIAIPGATDLEGIAISPDGSMAYVTDGNGDEVFPVNLNTRSVGLPIQTVSGGYPFFITMTPDGGTVYVSEYDAPELTPISTATNAAGSPVTVGQYPTQEAIVPDQGPTAAFSRQVRGHTMSLNGSRSSDSDGHVASYAWSFGDRSGKTTSTASFSHAYRRPGRYQVRLTVTDNEGCSTSLVFTGQTAYCNGTGAAAVSHTVVLRTRVRIRTGFTRVSAGKVKIRLACSGGFRCRGTLTLRAGKTKVGSARYSIANGKTRKVTVRLNSAGRHKLSASKSHRLRTKATATVRGGRKATRRATLVRAG